MKKSRRQINEDLNNLTIVVEDIRRVTDTPYLDSVISDQLSMTRESLEKTIENILIENCQQFIPEFMQSDFSLEFLLDPNDEHLTEIAKKATHQQIGELMTKIDGYLNKIQQHPAYRDAIKAYRANDQQTLSRLLPKLGYKQVQKPAIVYHGIQNLESQAAEDYTGEIKPVSPQKYAKKIKQILFKGLNPSQNSDNFPDLESIFVVKKPEQTYGFAGIKFNPGQYPLYQLSAAPSAGFQIVAPHLRSTHLQVFIRDISFWDYLRKTKSDTLDIFKMPRETCQQYINKLKTELLRNGIHFEILLPQPLTSL